MVRKILELGDETLRKTCKPMKTYDLRLWLLLRDMAETMYKAEGVGLAAVQVGVLRRVVVLDVGDGFMELVNPEIISVEGEQEAQEGCLSLPGEYGVTKRPAVVKVQAQDRTGKWHIYKGTELKARCFCHEIDHLDGILFTQKVIRKE